MQTLYYFSQRMKNSSKTNTYKMLVTQNESTFKIKCKNDKDKTIGILDFALSNDTALLKFVKVDDLEQNQGVGTSLLEMMEFIATKNKVNKVIGEFYPESKDARKFYEENGYTFCLDKNCTKESFDYDDLLLFKKLDYYKCNILISSKITEDKSNVVQR